jgi:serine/threonine protein kinase
MSHSSERSVRARSIFLQVIEEPAARAHLLESGCGDDPGLRAEVERLLRAHERMGSFQDRAPPLDGMVDAPLTERAGSVIGPYKLIEPIGEGGMGVVFMAEQTHPVRRLVALKLLKPGLDTRRVTARFEAERQALAMMDHPHIAKVLDGGATSRSVENEGEPAEGSGSGRPYFVMELVKGVPITRFCDERRLTPRQRLALFIPVCQAVQHAHQKGIIHRDLKPSNVLVALYDDKPVPKVIDFGIAKAVGEPLTERTLHTGFGAMVGTIEYMSPEQAAFNQLDVDTRSDVYSLGVLLFELLTGTTPLEHAQVVESGVLEALRIIREEEVPTLKSRLSKTRELAVISANRATQPEQLTRLVTGEVDWIVMKALEKDRERRYQTAAELAADIERYLGDQPVQAFPPSAAYRLKKFVRRHRMMVGAGLAVLLALVVGLAGTTWGLWTAVEQRRLAAANEAKAIRAAQAELNARLAAQQSEADTEDVLGFIESRLFAAFRPERTAGGLGREASLREAVERSLPFVAESFSDRPLVEARLRMTLAISYSHLGEAEQAELHCKRARDLYTAELGPHHAKTLSALNNLAICYRSLGRFEESLALHEETLALRRLHLPLNDADTLNSMTNVANALFSLHRYEEALALREEVLALSAKGRGPKHRETLRCMTNLATSLLATNRLDEGLELLRRTLDLQAESLGANDPDLLTTRQNLASCLRDLGRADEAVVHDQEVLRVALEVFGPGHWMTVNSTINLGNSLAVLGRHDEALPLRETAVERMRARYGPGHPLTLGCLWNLASNLADVGRFDEALKACEECLMLAEGQPVDPNLIPEVTHIRLVIFREKQDAAACRAAAEAWDALGRTDAESLFLAARMHSVAGAVLQQVEEDVAVSAGEITKELDLAMQRLQAAVAAGFEDADRLKDVSDFDPVREREDFRALVAEVERRDEG